MMVGLVLVCSRVLPKNTFMQCFPDSVHICPRTFLDGDSTCGSFRFHHKVTYGEGYRGHCKSPSDGVDGLSQPRWHSAGVGGTLRTSNLVRSARAAYETFCKLESEYPQKPMETRLDRA